MYEYKIMHYGTVSKYEDALPWFNIWGKDGWRIVSVNISTMDAVTVLFERPIK